MGNYFELVQRFVYKICLNLTTLKLKLKRMRKLAVFLTCALLFVAQAYAQTARTVTGKVTDEKGAPLSGVTISAVGANKNALTDNAGNFSIQVTEKVKTLRITYVGFDSKEVSINGLSTVSVNLN
jgi:hypothetical protein